MYASATPTPACGCRRSWSSWPRSVGSSAPCCCVTRCARRSPSDHRSVSSPVAAPETLVDEEAIGALVRRLAGEIAADHPDGVVLVGVLKGALIFLADLARA